MFSWKEEDKEFYYRKAQRIFNKEIPEGKGRILVDRDSFGIKGSRYAVVHIKPLSGTKDKALVKKLLKLDGFREIRTIFDKGKSCVFKGCLEIKLRGKDRKGE